MMIIRAAAAELLAERAPGLITESKDADRYAQVIKRLGIRK